MVAVGEELREHAQQLQSEVRWVVPVAGLLGFRSGEYEIQSVLKLDMRGGLEAHFDKTE